MAKSVGTADYKVRRSIDKPARAADATGNGAVVDVLQLLARAARQFHTYPATSPLCTDAIDACQRAFTALELDRPLAFRVTPHDLVVDDAAIGRGTIVEQELARPLHRARVASIEVDRAASVRDWSQFCTVLAASARLSSRTASFAELLVDAGVGAIVPRVTPRPEVLEVGAPPSAVQSLVERERTRQSELAATGPAQCLYPADKGWVRVDPAVDYELISLVDLAVLVNDPVRLATMLSRLVDEEASDAASGSALEQRYDDVVRLIGALDPRLGRMLLSKLAHAVLDLDSDRRRALLRRAVLPGLLDGRFDSEALLGEFPDVDLAEALCLLLDLEAGAPELVALALDRLRLPADRRTALVPMIQKKLATRSSPDAAVDRWSAAGFDKQAAALLRLEAGVAKSFDEFAAFDLSVTEQTSVALGGIRDAIATTQPGDAQLACAISLAQIEPNPSIASAIVARALPALEALVREERWPDATRWIARMAGVAAALERSRPDVAKVVREALSRFCDRAFVLQLARLCSADPGRTYAAAIVAALGPSILPSWLAALDAPADRVVVRALAPLMCESARLLAATLADRLPGLGADAARSVLIVLGHAGGGYEPQIAAQVTATDQARSREALRALARIGSAKAADLVVDQLERGPAPIQPLAEEALWRLPATIAVARTRELLKRRDFVTRHPHSAARLLERVAQSAGDGLDPVLESLTPLRFRFWSPAVARVGAKARDLLQ